MCVLLREGICLLERYGVAFCALEGQKVSVLKSERVSRCLCVVRASSHVKKITVCVCIKGGNLCAQVYVIERKRERRRQRWKL